MSRFEDVATLLTGLKGAPASVIWAFYLAGRPLSQRELIFLTGYSEKPVRRAIRELLEKGILQYERPSVLALVDAWAHLPVRTGEMARPSNPAGVEWSAATGEWTGQKAPEGTSGADKTRATVEQAEAKAGTGAGAKEGGATTGESGGWEGEDAGGGQMSRKNRRQDDQHVVVDSLDAYPLEEDQQQHGLGADRRLAGLLQHMGINGRAFNRLAARQDLVEQPEVVVAWWWYYRSQEWVRNPAGATIGRLDNRDEPPGGFLALARAWPGLPDGIRQELESLHLRNWSAEQIAGSLRPAHPPLTAEAVRAYMALWAETPEELEPKTP